MGMKKVKMLQKKMKFEKELVNNKEVCLKLSNVIHQVSKPTAFVDADSSKKVILSKAQICLYQQLQNALHSAPAYHPAYNTHAFNTKDGSKISGEQRDAAVNNMRFLHMFYGFSSDTFALAVNLLDRFLVKVKAHWRYLSCIATSCYYIALKVKEEDEIVPGAAELIGLSQCSCSVADLLRMERVILEKLQWSLNAVTPTTFLHYFFGIGRNSFPRQITEVLLDKMEAQLNVCLCQHQFAQFQSPTMALALFSHVLQETRVLNARDTATLILNLQYFCHVADWEFMHCKGLIMDYLMLYHNQPNRRPQLHLVWVVSRRTLLHSKPSTRAYSDLCTIAEHTDADADASDPGLVNSESENEQMPVTVHQYHHW